MNNVLTVAELKRRGMAAIEEGLQHGPIHIMKRNRAAAVVLSEEEYQRLIHGRTQPAPSMTAMQWLLQQPSAGTREKAEIDSSLAEERNW
ncbi:type II toxin-antitoxin system Phd/YefM family antitoxin [Paraburkholderia sp. Ac-20342]|uniref:hypothetical protein n=1 Tax=Paraburkholderia sp. Ac-20342 TaxID=2703889 RepID=UPI00197E0B35|nr:hypothetical protein [Paraburkholderia sp. Ac-20342]MBN3849433.1 type II toxin-antitoxin system Phd/YefM family antitoxin [Paraburkholderia sp. Ac-20342]